jgi:hypothetical protein
MRLWELIKSACVAAALGCLVSPADAIEVFGGPGARVDDGLITKVYVARRGVYVGPRGGVYRGGVYRGGVYRGGVYRGGYYHGAGYWGGWARPGWYRWAPGGAIAAGAAIGVLAAGAAVAYAGHPPGPGLCWYYTDPSYRAGFWDAC